jgi:hypothetical protein
MFVNVEVLFEILIEEIEDQIEFLFVWEVGNVLKARR